jgi:hypothetical protein
MRAAYIFAVLLASSCGALAQDYNVRGLRVRVRVRA